MGFRENEVEQFAHQMLAQHGHRAAVIAVEQLNECIDRGDWDGRDTFAMIVHRIHELSAPAMADC